MSDSPPPVADGTAPAQQPSPLMVGKQFVKQYYQVLSKQPDQIHRFYHQETSYLSDATGSNVTDPMTLDVYNIATRWGGEDNSKMIIELENGAIDAQPSVDGSILLVVTGHVSFLGSHEKSAFVHTFFLTTYPNTRRFYVHNDVLRFLSSTSTGASEEAPASTTSSPTNADNEDEVEAPAVNVLENEPVAKPVVPDEIPVAVEDAPGGEEEAPGGGVEESKEVAPEEEEETPAASMAGNENAPAKETEQSTEGEAPAAVKSSADAGKEEPLAEVSNQSEKAATKENGKGGKRNKGRGRSPPQEEAKQQPAASKPPSSWASLVASGKGAPGSPSPAKATPAEKPSQEASKPAENTTQSAQPEKKETANGTNNTTSSSTGGGGGGGGKKQFKRDPDCTLVVKNLPDNTKEGELRGLFEKFASEANAKIIGTAVSNHRGLGFVDFDAVAPVLAAVEVHSKDPIYLNGRKLDIDQKTAEQQKRNRNRGGYNRSGSPGNNNNSNFNRSGGGGGGGRGQYNRRGGGDRGGRTGGGRGSRGGR